MFLFHQFTQATQNMSIHRRNGERERERERRLDEVNVDEQRTFTSLEREQMGRGTTHTLKPIQNKGQKDE